MTSLGKLTRLNRKGAGVYGIVYSARETSEGEDRTFAVKRNLVDETVDFIGSIRELDILVRLSGHPHIVSVNSISFGDPFTQDLSEDATGINTTGGVLSPVIESGYKDDKIHFIFEEAEMDGVMFLEGASWRELKRCLLHLLLGLEYCHGHGVIHRDLKPANLLIFLDSEEITLKICDFGLSKPITYQGIQTPKIVTSWYRAPEIVLEQPYDQRADLWSVGCIMYEMIDKLPMLNGCNDKDITILHQLHRYFPELKIPANKRKVVGDRKAIPWKKLLEEKCNLSEMKAEGWDFSQSMDLISQFLSDQETRISARRALAHPFFSEYQDYIETIRKDYPPSFELEVPMIIPSSPIRDQVGQMAITIFKSPDPTWYSPRILFQGLSLFDRYLQVEANLDPSRIRLAFGVCLYIAFKYFATLTTSLPFVSIYGEITQDELTWAEEFEIQVLEQVSRYLIYRPTLYEAADRFDEILDHQHVEDLLTIFITGMVKVRKTQKIEPIDGKTPSQVYRLYRDK